MVIQADDYGPGVKAAATVLVVLLLLGIVGFLFVWTQCRIQVDQGQLACLIKLTGKDITNDMVSVPDASYKGVQLAVLREGRYFYNPYTWTWTYAPAKEVPQGQVGVLVRRYGKPLPPGQVIAYSPKQWDSTEDVINHEKGIVGEVLTPGRYYLNPIAYDLELHPMKTIESGFQGVVTLLAGRMPENPNTFVVQEGERGTQPYLLPPGTHPKYSNPYVYEVIPVDVRSQKFELSGATSITFPSRDGFDITVEGTMEWAVFLDKLPETEVKYVDEEDRHKSGGIANIQNKLLLPLARSLARNVGGQHNAVDYITGAAKLRVQNEVQKRLAADCQAEGIEIRSFVIRSSTPPEAILLQYRRRELAKRERERFLKEAETEIGVPVMEGATTQTAEDGSMVMVGGTPKVSPDGKAIRTGGRLTQTIQERSKDREDQFGEIRQQVATRIRAAEQYEGVTVTKAQQDVEVAKINLEAASNKAAAVVATGKALADVTVLKARAEAEGKKAQIAPFGSGEKYADYLLTGKLAPAIRSIWSNTDGPFADLFKRFSQPGPEKKAN